MLTDYHVHLRPDDPDAPVDRYFTRENVDRYLAAARAAGITELGASEHVYRFTDALAVSRHPLWEEMARDDLGEYCEFVRTTPLRLGLEVDYIAGAEEAIAKIIEAHDFDYVIGSVHMVGKTFVDYGIWDIWDEESDPDRVWERYVELIVATASSGMYDILGHADLVKMWGPERPWPERDPRSHFRPALEAIAESGMAVELSTAGLRKPVAEMYPSRALCEMCVEAGIPFVVSSDAHGPDQIGYEYGRAVKELRDLGVDEICVFERRERRMEPLG